MGRRGLIFAGEDEVDEHGDVLDGGDAVAVHISAIGVPSDATGTEQDVDEQGNVLDGEFSVAVGVTGSDVPLAMDEIDPRVLARVNICIVGIPWEEEPGVAVGLKGEAVLVFHEGRYLAFTGHHLECVAVFECILPDKVDVLAEGDFFQAGAALEGFGLDGRYGFGDEDAGNVTAVKGVLATAVMVKWISR